MILGFSDPLFYLYFFYFLAAVFLAFFVPGNLVLSRIKLSGFSKVILSPIVGLVLWIYQGFIFGFLGVRWVSYFYLLFAFTAWVFFYGQKITKLNLFLKKVWFKLKQDKILVLIIAIGSLVQILTTVWFAGYKTAQGFNFCCLWFDSFYNLALTNSLVVHFPPFEPGMEGVVVHNYHYLSNLAIADLIRVFKLPLIQSSYQYMSLAVSLWLGLSALAFARELKIGRAFNRWLVFLIYFSGDLIFLLTFALGKGFDFSLHLPEKATTLWDSPPRVFALIILFGALTLFTNWIKNKSLYLGFVMAFVFASLIGVKVYIGIFALAGLGAVGFIYLLRREFKRLLILIVCLFAALALYLPVNVHAGGLVFTGFWRIENFAVSPQLGIINLELARNIYLAHQNYLKVSLIEFLYLAIYIYSLFGMFLLGLIQSRKSLSLIPGLINLFLLSGFAAALIAGLFFIQTKGGANTSQFLFTAYIVGSVYTALSLYYWLNKIKRKYLKIVLIILISALIGARVSRDIYRDMDNIISHRHDFVVSNQELQAINFLKHNTKKNDIVMVDENTAGSLSCYYLVFLSNRPFFLCGSSILNDHGVNIASRRTAEREVFKSTSVSAVGNELSKNKISSIYIETKDSFPEKGNKNLMRKVFGNKKITIFKVK